MEAGAAFAGAPTAGAEAGAPAAALPGAGEIAVTGADAPFAAGTGVGFAPAVPPAAAAACDAGAADTAEAVALAEAAAGAGSALAIAPVASSAGTFNTAPSFKRLGSLRMNAEGLASKIDLAARPSTALSCEPVTVAAISASDCPGLTVYCIAAEAAGTL